jgi:hypothetical protein
MEGPQQILHKQDEPSLVVLITKCLKIFTYTYSCLRINIYGNCIICVGSKEDLLHAVDDYKDESTENLRGSSANISEGSSCERQTPYHGSNLKMEIPRDHKPCSDNKFKAEGMYFRKLFSVIVQIERKKQSHFPIWSNFTSESCMLFLM